MYHMCINILTFSKPDTYLVLLIEMVILLDYSADVLGNRTNERYKDRQDTSSLQAYAIRFNTVSLNLNEMTRPNMTLTRLLHFKFRLMRSNVSTKYSK